MLKVANNGRIVDTIKCLQAQNYTLNQFMCTNILSRITQRYKNATRCGSWSFKSWCDKTTMMIVDAVKLVGISPCTLKDTQLTSGACSDRLFAALPPRWKSERLRSFQCDLTSCLVINGAEEWRAKTVRIGNTGVLFDEQFTMTFYSYIVLPKSMLKDKILSPLRWQRILGLYWN